MGELLVDLLPITMMSALTPWTLVGVTVLLASKGGVKNAVAFSLGWLTAILLLGAVIVAGVVAGGQDDAASVSWLQVGLQLGFGVAFLLFASVKWRSRPGPGEVVPEPAWIGKLDRIRWPAAFLFGAFWINGFLVVPAALEISEADVTGGQKAFALLFYAVGATIGQIALIGYRLLAPARATEGLARLRGWVGRNGTVTIAVVLAVLGGGLVVKAIAGALQI